MPSLLLTQMHLASHVYRSPYSFCRTKFKNLNLSRTPLEILSCQSISRGTLNISDSGKVNVTSSVIFLQKEEKCSRCIILLLLAEWICSLRSCAVPCLKCSNALCVCTGILQCMLFIYLLNLDTEIK